MFKAKYTNRMVTDEDNDTPAGAGDETPDAGADKLVVDLQRLTDAMRRMFSKESASVYTGTVETALRDVLIEVLGSTANDAGIANVRTVGSIKWTSVIIALVTIEGRDYALSQVGCSELDGATDSYLQSIIGRHLPNHSLSESINTLWL